MIKLIRQALLAAHEINCLPYGPMFWRLDNFALHQTTRRIFGNCSACSTATRSLSSSASRIWVCCSSSKSSRRSTTSSLSRSRPPRPGPLVSDTRSPLREGCHPIPKEHHRQNHVIKQIKRRRSYRPICSKRSAISAGCISSNRVSSVRDPRDLRQRELPTHRAEKESNQQRPRPCHLSDVNVRSSIYSSFLLRSPYCYSNRCYNPKTASAIPMLAPYTVALSGARWIKVTT